MPLIICRDCTHQKSDGRLIVAGDLAWDRELAAAGAKRTAIGCGLVGLAIVLLFAWCYNAVSFTSTPSSNANVTGSKR